MTESACSILMVDDDKSWQSINKIVLSKYGFRIYTASTKDEALEKIEAATYEIALVDLRLIDDDQTNFDGIEIIKRLRSKNPNTRILVKSGYLSPTAESELRFLGVGKDDVFDKSTTNRELADRVNEVYQEIKHR